LTQVCFFEPALPLFFFSAGFDADHRPSQVNKSNAKKHDG